MSHQGVQCSVCMRARVSLRSPARCHLCEFTLHHVVCVCVCVCTVVCVCVCVCVCETKNKSIRARGRLDKQGSRTCRRISCTCRKTSCFTRTTSLNFCIENTKKLPCKLVYSGKRAGYEQGGQCARPSLEEGEPVSFSNKR